MAKRSLYGLRAIVTGASMGIGYALAVAGARRGLRIVAMARSGGLLETLAREVGTFGGTIVPVEGDITSAEGRSAAIDAAVRYFGGLDILVNNAGIGASGHFAESDERTLRDIFEVNVFGTAEMTRLCLPELARGQTPLIVNISSVLGRRGYPARSYYSASKFAIQGLSDAIRAELVPYGVGVLVVNPGLTNTNFGHNMRQRDARIPLDHSAGMTPQVVAEATWNAAAAGKNEITLTLQGHLLVLVNRFCPWVFEFFARRKIRKLFSADRSARRAAMGFGPPAMPGGDGNDPMEIPPA